LILGANEGELDIIARNMIKDEVVADINVLRLSVKYRIVCNPQHLSATTCRGDALSVAWRKGGVVLLLR
jgi:hypothetical protein